MIKYSWIYIICFYVDLSIVLISETEKFMRLCYRFQNMTDINVSGHIKRNYSAHQKMIYFQVVTLLDLNICHSGWEKLLTYETAYSVSRLYFFIWPSVYKSVNTDYSKILLI